MNEIAKEKIKQGVLINDNEIDLSSYRLYSVPEELFNMSNLYRLILRGIKEGDHIRDINRIANYENLGKLISLKELYLEYNFIEDISFLKSLSNLHTLNLYCNRVKDISALENLTNLQVLNLRSNQIEDIFSLGKLTNLHTLELSNNQIEDFSPLSKLPNLKRLTIIGRKVFDTKSLLKLNKLEELNISFNYGIEFDFLTELTSLKSLDISHNQIKDIDFLDNLTNLNSLNLSCNWISDISSLKKLKNLKKLSLDENSISDISPLISLLKKGFEIGDDKEISLKGNFIINPPMYILAEGNNSIVRYFHELENKESIINNQTKLIFVGNSRAGKTSLWQFLKDKIYNEQADSTHGIKTEIWDSEPLGTEDKQNLAAHIWDFGGQEYYHATHRLFLADNAVYVLVWEKDNNKPCTRLEKFKLDDDPNGEIEEVELEHFPASYWLENIQYFAGKHCPVLIVQNKVDEEAFKANYTEGGKNLPDCFHLSVQNAFAFQQGNEAFEESNMDFQKFKLRLLKELRKNATAFKLVKYYAQVREALETKAKDTEYITVSELKDIALQFDETPDLENLLAYLKSFTNTVLYFPQNDVLKDRLYLNPTHISRDIYKILNKQVREKNGKFDMAHIKTRLHLTDDQEAERFVALMCEFDLIFEKSKTIKGTTKQQFITPQYLPKKEDLSDDMSFLIEGYAFETAFMIQFKSFVPRSLMLRFIAKKGELANQEMYWRNGIIYKSPTTQSMIKVEYDHEALTFTICVQDKHKQTVDMQNIVEQFVTLENGYDNIKISNDGKLYVELITIRKLQHETRGGDIYENGELIPLSKFDWLTQKIKTKETMTPEQLKESVNNYIGKAKTKEAMDAVATWAHENNQKQLKDDINLLKGELTALDRQETLGLLSFQEIAREKTKLNNRFLSLLNGIGEAPVAEIIEEPAPKKVPKKKAATKPAAKKILFLGANPFDTGKLNLKEEYAEIAKQLEDKGAKERLVLKSEFCTDLEGFQEKTNAFRPNILHFAGHGSDKNGELEDFGRGIGRPNWKENIGLIFHKSGYGGAMLINEATLDYNFQTFIEVDKIPIDVLVLNACYSTNQAEVLSKRVKYVVGVHNSIDDNASIDFSAGFYYGLSDGKTIEAAFRYGKGRAMPKLKDKNQIVLFIEGVVSNL